MNDIYHENILDHYKYPRNKGKIKCNSCFADSNPLCGDKLEFFLNIEKNKISGISFEGSGCAISLASASMLTEKLKGKDLDFVKSLKNEDIYDMLGIDLTPSRVKCALLSLKVAKMAVYKHLGEEIH